MSEKISRRDFLKAASKWSVLGASFALGSQYLSACTHLQNENLVKQSKGQFIYINKSLGYYFYIIQQEAVQRAVEARGYEFIYNVSNMDASKQTEQITAAIRRKPIAIIYDPIDSSQVFSKLIKTVEAKEVPVGVIDTPLANEGASISVIFDNYKGGAMAAEKIVELLTKKYKEPSGLVLNCYGDLDSVAWKLRKEGFEDTLKKHKKIKLISRETKGELTKAYDVTNNVLLTYPNLDAIHASSETPALGIYEALKVNSKLHPVGNPDHIILVTIDGEPIAHRWIKEKFLDASISQDPIAYGEICVEILDDYILKNKTLEKENYSNKKYYWAQAEIKRTTSSTTIVIPPFVIDKNNVDDKRLWANVAHDEWGLKYS